MKILSVGAELFHADGRTDRNDEADSRLFAMFRTCLRNCYTLVPSYSLFPLFVTSQYGISLAYSELHVQSTMNCAFSNEI
jgi:hypothetical protein